jgi:hypothetical protein
MPITHSAREKYYEDQARIKEHLPRIKALHKPNVKRYAALHNLPYQRLRHALQGKHDRTSRTQAHWLLSDHQDLALERYCDAVNEIGFGITKNLVETQANTLLEESFFGSEEAPRVGKHWASRWLARNTRYKRTKAAPMEVARKLAEQPDGILHWFSKLKDIMDSYSVQPDDLWNMDETGCRIGVNRNQYVYTYRNRTISMPSSNNRELITLVESVSATGASIGPMVIIKAATLLENWAIDLPKHYLINLTESGYSTDTTTLEWLKNFHWMTIKHTKGVWRLLLLDGHGSHYTKEFATFAAEVKILLFAFPPHLTHILQPLDVGCFQPLKWYHGRSLDYASRSGATEINKADFLSTIDEIRRLTFTSNTIKSGWRRTGLHPWDPEKVVTPLREDNNCSNQASGGYETAGEIPRPTPVQLKTPELRSSDVEASQSPSYYKSKLSSNRLKRSLNIANMERISGIADDLALMPDRGALPQGNWQAPETIRQVELQAQQVDNVLGLYLPPIYIVHVRRHIAGLNSLARVADGLKRELLNTKAAEVARDDRRKRKRRKLDIGGGPIYAEDCRRIAAKRVEDEITTMERHLEDKKRREINTRVNKWRRLYPQLRAAGKRACKRMRDGVQVWRSDDLHRQRVARSSLAITTSRKRVEETLNTPYNHRIASSIVTYHDDVDAATIGYQVRRLADPYDAFVTRRDKSLVVQSQGTLNTDTFTSDSL